MDLATVKRKLLANANITRLYSILGGAMYKEHDHVSILIKDDTGNVNNIVVHRFNQHGAPMKYTMHNAVGEIQTWLTKGDFVITAVSNRAQRDDPNKCYIATIRKGRKLPYLDLEPVNLLRQSRMMESGIHDWFERVLGDYLRPVRRCLRVKEEIMMRAWHPDRVLRLLEAGIDVEEM